MRRFYAQLQIWVLKRHHRFRASRSHWSLKVWISSARHRQEQARRRHLVSPFFRREIRRVKSYRRLSCALQENWQSRYPRKSGALQNICTELRFFRFTEDRKSEDRYVPSRTGFRLSSERRDVLWIICAGRR